MASYMILSYYSERVSVVISLCIYSLCLAVLIFSSLYLLFLFLLLRTLDLPKHMRMSYCNGQQIGDIQWENENISR